MRRPVKPFVTEYKSGSRKTKDLFDVAPVSEPLLQTAPESVRTVSSDDSYEAAMRAADALFGTPTASAHTAEAVSKPAEHQGGRILQAIEDEPHDPFAKLEVERAPKRRGRKPGSKNQPKPRPVVEEAIAIATPTVPHMAVRRAAILAPRPLPDAPKERYAWVRTTLRPGEKWKRRLPKVAW